MVGDVSGFGPLSETDYGMAPLTFDPDRGVLQNGEPVIDGEHRKPLPPSEALTMFARPDDADWEPTMVLPADARPFARSKSSVPSAVPAEGIVVPVARTPADGDGKRTGEGADGAGEPDVDARTGTDAGAVSAHNANAVDYAADGGAAGNGTAVAGDPTVAMKPVAAIDAVQTGTTPGDGHDPVAGSDDDDSPTGDSGTDDDARPDNGDGPDGSGDGHDAPSDGSGTADAADDRPSADSSPADGATEAMPGVGEATMAWNPLDDAEPDAEKTSDASPTAKLPADDVPTVLIRGNGASWPAENRLALLARSVTDPESKRMLTEGYDPARDTGYAASTGGFTNPVQPAAVPVPVAHVQAPDVRPSGDAARGADGRGGRKWVLALAMLAVIGGGTAAYTYYGPGAAATHETRNAGGPSGSGNAGERPSGKDDSGTSTGDVDGYGSTSTGKGTETYVPHADETAKARREQEERRKAEEEARRQATQQQDAGRQEATGGNGSGAGQTDQQSGTQTPTTGPSTAPQPEQKPNKPSTGDGGKEPTAGGDTGGSDGSGSGGSGTGSDGGSTDGGTGTGSSGSGTGSGGSTGGGTDTGSSGSGTGAGGGQQGGSAGSDDAADDGGAAATD